MIEKLGGRKFILAVVILTLTTVLAFVKADALSTQFVAMCLGILAAFTTGNVVAKKVNNNKLLEEVAPLEEAAHSLEEITPQVDFMYITQKIEDLESKLDSNVTELQNKVESQTTAIVGMNDTMGNLYQVLMAAINTPQGAKK